MKTLFAGLLFALLPVGAADFPGTWNVSTQNENGEPLKFQMILKEEAGALTGAMQAGERRIPMSKLQRQGDQITFQIPYNDITVTIKLTLQADKLKGSWSVESGETGPVNAERAASSPVAGKWNLTATMQDGNQMKVTLEIKDEGGRLSGSLTTQDGNSLPISEAKLEGKVLSFKLSTDNGAFALKLTFEGETGKGTYLTPDGASGPLTANR
jgi:hypothetical protein